MAPPSSLYFATERKQNRDSRRGCPTPHYARARPSRCQHIAGVSTDDRGAFGGTMEQNLPGRACRRSARLSAEVHKAVLKHEVATPAPVYHEVEHIHPLSYLHTYTPLLKILARSPRTSNSLVGFFAARTDRAPPPPLSPAPPSAAAWWPTN